MTNKEKIFHLVCACVFLYMIRDLKNIQNCNQVNNNTPPQQIPNPSNIEMKKDSNWALKDTEIKIKKKELGNLSETLLLIYT